MTGGTAVFPEPVEPEEEIPGEEQPVVESRPETGEETSGGLGGITGAVISAIGSTTGIAIMIIIGATLGSISFSYFVSKKKKKK